MKRPPLQRGGFITGLVVGLLLGLGVALAVALYVTKTPVPFIDKLPQRTAEQDAAEAEKNKNWDPNAPLAGKNPARPVAPAPSGTVLGASAAGAASAAPGPTGTPAPGVAASAPAVRAAAAASAPPLAASRAGRDPAAILAGQPDAARPPAKPASGVTIAFFVQAGAFARSEDAEAQRAKLALLGLDARVTEREQAGRTVYRVRVGPFDAREPAEDTQVRLAGAGIEANLVRVER
jgi:cell division protein FtsN